MLTRNRSATPGVGTADTSRAKAFRNALPGIFLALLVLPIGCGGAPKKANSPEPREAARTQATPAAKNDAPAPKAAACANFYPADFKLREGRANDAQKPMPGPPAKGAAFAEPNFDTCVVRATDHVAEYPDAALLRNDYSRRQAFNADGTRFFVFGPNGFWHLYDAVSLKYIGRLIGLAGDAEPQWHPTDPNILYYVPSYGGTRLLKLDVRSDSTKVAADFAGQLPPWAKKAEHIWTKAEGSPSADGRFWGFQVEDGKYQLLGYIVWDLTENRLAGSREEHERPDHVSMTPSGRWFTSSSDGDGTWAWSPDFSTKKKLHHKSEHSDLAIGPNGHDYYVSIDYQSDRGDVFFVDIDACAAVPASATASPECPRTKLFETYVGGSVGALHISGKAFQKPGWALVSAYGTHPTKEGPYPWFANKIFAIELKSDGKVYELAYHRSNAAGYWFEPQASVNRDFTRILFNSSWGSDDEKSIDAYLIGLPADALH